MAMFRPLNADEIEVRVSNSNDNGVALLLYKTARADMAILDECVGAMNWQRSHSRDNANCTISIWDEAKGMWISKEDTGAESNMDAAKGLASDSFKRAGFNWGIGRELYTAPFIWVTFDSCKRCASKSGKPTTYDRFSVAKIETEDGVIRCISIRNDTSKRIVYNYIEDGYTPKSKRES